MQEKKSGGQFLSCYKLYRKGYDNFQQDTFQGVFYVRHLIVCSLFAFDSLYKGVDHFSGSCWAFFPNYWRFLIFTKDLPLVLIGSLSWRANIKFLQQLFVSLNVACYCKTYCWVGIQCCIKLSKFKPLYRIRHCYKVLRSWH